MSFFALCDLLVGGNAKMVSHLQGVGILRRELQYMRAVRTAVLGGCQQMVRRRLHAALSRLPPQAPASDRHLPGGHASAAGTVRRIAVPVGARIYSR